MRPLRLLLAAALLVGLGMSGAASARRVRLTCVDGVLNIQTRRVRCDADQACDGACTFVVAPPFCEVIPCLSQTLVVPAGQRLVVRERGVTLVLRCRAHPPTLRCPVTTSSTSTSSTTPGGSCRSDADCNTDNSCSVGFCEQGGVCQQFCVCLHDGVFTCDPALADPCQSNADCPPVLGDPCRHCDGGLCKSHPLCV